VRVPPQRALLPGDVERVGELGGRLYRALRDHVGAVRPPAPQLKDAVPAHAAKRIRKRERERDREKKRRRGSAGLPYIGDPLTTQLFSSSGYGTTRACTYQWTDTGYGDPLTTWTTRVSPSLTSMVGPGICWFTVYITLFMHSCEMLMPPT